MTVEGIVCETPDGEKLRVREVSACNCWMYWHREPAVAACWRLLSCSRGRTAPHGQTSGCDCLQLLLWRQVWQNNLEEEMVIIRDIVDGYPCLAMDTEFPGVVARPVGNFKNSGEYHYQMLRWAGCFYSRRRSLALPTFLLYQPRQD